MDQDKQTGSFYTPSLLVEYMSVYALRNYEDDIKILEPSFGDGRFLRHLVSESRTIDAVEIDSEKIDKVASEEYRGINLIKGSFIEYALLSEKKYDLIIGNPPYITKKLLSEEEKIFSQELIKHWSLPDNVFQNIWVSFVLASLKILNKTHGSIFFVLPFEFLQVHYAEKLRNFLEERFNLIEITTFVESVFPKIEQDVCLVYMTNRQGIEPIVKYTTVRSINDFNPVEYSEIKRNKPLKKWSNSILNDDEIELLTSISRKYLEMSDLGDSSPGIVTGANSFFILNRSQVEELKCSECVVPIIQKSTIVPSLLNFYSNDFEGLDKLGKKLRLLHLSNIASNNFSDMLNEYLERGVEQKIHERYKCNNRKRWFDVPIIESGDLMFFKRYNKYPRLIVNQANVYTTDASYNIRLNKGFDPFSVAFCFYNSLTLTLCEYNGRFYGGGVGELVPSEFKTLRIPYRDVAKSDIEKVDSMMRGNTDIWSIIDYVDQIVLNDLSAGELRSLKKIREKYLLRRLKGSN